MTSLTRRAYAVSGLALVVMALAASCRTPTEISLVVSTDVKCSDLRGTSITVGRLGEIETKAPTTTSTFCDPSGDLGVLVVVPSGSNGDDVAMKVVAGVGRDAESCVPPYGKGCIVARRAMHYLPHAGLRVAIPLRAACDGVACSETETCVSGVCGSATIADPGACSGSQGCGEGALGPPSGADGGLDGGSDGALDGGVDGAPIVPSTYHDMTNASFWSAFDMATVHAGAAAFLGSLFDGRYVYFVPNVGGVPGVVRYDTQAPFATGASWSAFDTTTVNAAASGFAGAVFDGRYANFVPLTGAPGARFDTQAPFAAGTSWSTFDVTTVNAGAKGFLGATFDGRYAYLVPKNNGAPDGIVARYDTQAPFTTGASWTTFDMTTVNPGATGYQGGAFDGRYVYFVPSNNAAAHGLVARYDTQAPFATGASWTTFDMTTVNAGAKGFTGAAFDGRYVYFVPLNNAAFDGIVARYDTQAPFATGASWSTFDTATVNAGAKGFAGAAFDGRYVYFVPFTSGAFDGLIARYDTQAPFATGAAWTTFDMTTVNATAKGFRGAAFDGRYVYLVPGVGSVVTRFDAKTPPSMPTLPGFSGSFL